MFTAGQCCDAIFDRCFIVCDGRPVWQFDHILGTEGADDRVVTAVGPEDDAVRRGQRRDVDRIVAGIAIDSDGIEVQARERRIEVADDLDRVTVVRAAIRRFGLLPLLAVVLSVLTVISSILSSSAMMVVVSPTVRVMTISVLAPDTAIPAKMAAALA